MFSLARAFDDLNAKIKVLDQYSMVKTGAAQDTVVAKYYNDFTQDLMKMQQNSHLKKSSKQDLIVN